MSIHPLSIPSGSKDVLQEGGWEIDNLSFALPKLPEPVTLAVIVKTRRNEGRVWTHHKYTNIFELNGKIGDLRLGGNPNQAVASNLYTTTTPKQGAVAMQDWMVFKIDLPVSGKEQQVFLTMNYMLPPDVRCTYSAHIVCRR